MITGTIPCINIKSPSELRSNTGLCVNQLIANTIISIIRILDPTRLKYSKPLKSQKIVAMHVIDMKLKHSSIAIIRNTEYNGAPFDKAIQLIGIFSTVIKIP